MLLATRSGAGWLLACFSLAGLIAFELSDDASLSTDVQAAPLPAFARLNSDDRSMDFWQMPVSIKADITSQPLFTVNRKPFVQKAEITGPQTEAADSRSSVFELVGTLLTDEMGAALILDGADKAHRLHLGQTIDEWRIDMVAEDRIQMRRDDSMKEVLLREEAPGQRASGRSR